MVIVIWLCGFFLKIRGFVLLHFYVSALNFSNIVSARRKQAYSQTHHKDGRFVWLLPIKPQTPPLVIFFFFSPAKPLSLKASRLLYFLHINMSPSSAPAGCQLNASLGLRKHHLCRWLIACHCSHKSLEIWSTCHLVCDYESLPLQLWGPFRRSLAWPRSAFVTWMREQTSNHSEWVRKREREKNPAHLNVNNWAQWRAHQNRYHCGETGSLFFRKCCNFIYPIGVIQLTLRHPVLETKIFLCFFKMIINNEF